MTDEIHRLRVAVNMYRRITNDNEAEIKRLRDAIVEHRKGLLRGGPESGLDVTEFDRNLWAVLIDEKRE